MSINDSWFVLALIVQISAMIFKPLNIGRGYVTRQMMRLSRIPCERPYFSVYRVAQIFMLAAFRWAFMPFPIYAAILILLYLDDWMFGDDDFKKKWKEVKNKIKWKMKILTPAKQRI